MNNTYEPGVRENTGRREADWAAWLARLERVYRNLGLAPDLAREATRADVTILCPAVETAPAAL